MARGRSTPADRIFISYRREDTAYPAGWLFDRLAAEFGDAQVFKDVDSIDLGDDFVDVISAAVGSTDVLLALIGEEWLTAADEQGKPRLDDPDDFVRLEIEAALAREVRVIPILVDGARMPRADELPVTIAALARRQALELSPDRFEFDTSRLLKVLKKTLAEQRIRQPPGTSSAGAGERPRVDGKDADGAPAPRGPASGGSSSAVPDARAPADRLKHFRRPRLLIATGLAVVLVAVLIGIVVVNSGGDAPPSGDSDGKTTPARNSEGQSGAAIPFTDDFSSSKSGWDDAGDSPIGGHYEGGAYRIFAERAPDRWGVSASPGIPASAADLRIGVSARRIGGSAAEKYGYGVFCRADGPDNFYAFTIWASHASIAKRVDGGYVPLGEPNPDVSSAVHGDGNKELRAVCTTVEGQRAVDLQFWVNDEIILSRTDREDPYESGTFGVQVALGRAGPTGDTLEVEFDDFAVSEE